MIIKLIQPKMNRRPVDTDLKIRMSPSLALLTIANIIPREHTVLIENENIEAINYKDILMHSALAWPKQHGRRL